MLIGSRCVKTWSSTQKGVILSSGEAELVAAMQMCTEVMGIMQLAQDWGIKLEGSCQTQKKWETEAHQSRNDVNPRKGREWIIC